MVGCCRLLRQRIGIGIQPRRAAGMHKNHHALAGALFLAGRFQQPCKRLAGVHGVKHDSFGAAEQADGIKASLGRNAVSVAHMLVIHQHRTANRRLWRVTQHHQDAIGNSGNDGGNAFLREQDADSLHARG